MKPYWVGWWHEEGKKLSWQGPWWVTGYKDTYNEFDTSISICAAVMATSEEDAKAKIQAAYDNPNEKLNWRFAGERTLDWTPFTNARKRAAWMKWPYPSNVASQDSAQAERIAKAFLLYVDSVGIGTWVPDSGMGVTFKPNVSAVAEFVRLWTENSKESDLAQAKQRVSELEASLAVERSFR